MLRLAVLATTAAVAGLLVLPPASAEASPPTCFGKRATIVGTKQADRLVGTDHRDVIVGLGGDDQIKGGRGDDLICGGAGADGLYGGPGNDRINGGFGRVYTDRGGTFVANDRIFPGAGNDEIVPVFDNRAYSWTRDIISYADSARPVTVDVPAKTVTGLGRDRITTLAVQFVGSTGDDLMLGGPGVDRFTGNAGDDTLRGEGGADQLMDGTESGPDPVDADVLDGGDGSDEIWAYEGFDTISAGAGNDTVADYGKSNDRIDLGGGDDYASDRWVLRAGAELHGGAGNDMVNVGNHFWRDGKKLYPRVVVDLRSGITTVKAPSPVTVKVTGIEFLNQWDVPLTFYGTDANETIWSGLVEARTIAHGYGGNDELWGTGRDDLLDGGTGNDKAVPGGGTDRCVSMERQSGRCEVNE